MSDDRYETAFPVPGDRHDDGMSLRDYFAAKALSGMCADATFNPNDILGFGEVAYKIADSMLEARKK